MSDAPEDSEAEAFLFAESEKPTATRVGGRYKLNSAARARVKRRAKRLRMKPDKIVADIERGLAAARMLLAVLRIPVRDVANGRPRQDVRNNLIRAIASQVAAERGSPDGWKAATEALAKRGIFGQGKRPLNPDYVRDLCHERYDPERNWFPPAIKEGKEPIP